MTQSDNERSHESPPESDRSLYYPGGSSGSPQVDQVDELLEDEDEDDRRIELMEILKEISFSDYLQVGVHFAQHQRCELPSIQKAWRRIWMFLDVARDEADILLEHYDSIFDESDRFPVPSVEWEIFHDYWYPFADIRDLREYEMYLADRTLPNPLVSQDFLARKAAWEANEHE